MKITLIILAFRAAFAALRYNRADYGTNNFKAEVIEFKGRIYVPYGPDLIANPPQSSSEQPWKGMGFGMGATEHWAYDYVEGYIYSHSEAGGFITVIDYSKAAFPGKVSDFSFDVGGRNVEVRDIVVCPPQGLVFVTVSDRSKVLIYESVKRASPKVPALIQEVEVGNTPDAMKLSNDCKILAVANQNEGTGLLTEGAVTLLTNFRDPQGAVVKRVLLNGFSDEQLLARNVHMPLTKNAMIYWNKELGFGWDVPGGIIDQYNPAITFDPEFIAFNYDATELYLNLQDNSALVRISTDSGRALSVDGYGLKPITSGGGADIVDDGECKLVTNPCLYLKRAPDSIATVEYEGVNYIFISGESGGADFQDYEEVWDANKVFNGANFSFTGFSLPGTLFVPGSPDQGCSANFNSACKNNGLEWCSNLEISVGSSAVDYSNPEAPVMDKIVGLGGRGIALYRIPTTTNEPISLIWDSGSDFERQTCALFPWANNAVMDEEFAPIGGALWTFLSGDDRDDIHERNDPNDKGCTFGDGTTGACPLSQTVDELAEESGLEVESVTVGVACDRLVVVTCGEANGVCLIYDFTEINNLALIKTFILNPVGKDKNPDQTYGIDMGDIDPEVMMMVTPDQSPTGKAGIIVGGAHSGTISFYEFVCAEESKRPTSGGVRTEAMLSFTVAAAALILALA